MRHPQYLPIPLLHRQEIQHQESVRNIMVRKHRLADAQLARKDANVRGLKSAIEGVGEGCWSDIADGLMTGSCRQLVNDGRDIKSSCLDAQNQGYYIYIIHNQHSTSLERQKKKSQQSTYYPQTGLFLDKLPCPSTVPIEAQT